MRELLTTLTLSFACHLAAQSGPGGAGASSSNVLWLDANSGITRSGVAVSQWNDRSGNSNHALLPGSIPSANPSFVSGSVNGYPSLDFDGTDDQLWVTDHASLDLTQWHFFVVLTADVQKNYNAWMVKGNDSDENFEMLSYNDGNIHTPTMYSDGMRTFPSSADGQVVIGTFDIMEYSYSAAVGRDVYKNASTIITDNENKTPRVNNFPVYIGNERSTTGRTIDGDIAEVVAYNAPLNSAQRIVVNNYLSAKYGRTLSANDIYVQDNSGQGDFDHDVAGIGRVDASNIQSDSRGSGIIQINNPTGLGNNEFLFWGHNGGTLGSYGVTDLPSGIQGRLARVWRTNEVAASGTAVDVGNIDMTFDLSAFAAVSASDLRLLVDTDNDGVFADETPITGATWVSGSLYRFAGVSAIVNDRRFTLGTSNQGRTPLPIELVSFSASPVDNSAVQLEWRTATERDNDHFTVERSGDMQEWTSVALVDAVGNSTTSTNYTAMDPMALAGVSYYRLRQTDLDGTSTLSDIRAVDLSMQEEDDAVVFPNPNNGAFHVFLRKASSHPVSLSLVDATGRIVASRSVDANADPLVYFDPQLTAPGLYQLRVAMGDAVRVHAVQITQ